MSKIKKYRFCGIELQRILWKKNPEGFENLQGFRKVNPSPVKVYRS